MGAWGVETFANDSALDWLYGLDDNNGSLITETLTAVVDSVDEYLDADLCCGALAAAEIIAAAKNKPDEKPMPDDATNWLASHPLNVTPELVNLAVKAVTKIRSDSELKALWDESADKADWYADVDDLLSRLN